MGAGLHCYIRINMDSRLDDLFRVYRKDKIVILNKMGKNHDALKGYRNCHYPLLDDT